MERDSRGEDVKVDSVTNSGLQCTDFFVLPDDAVRCFRVRCSDPDPSLGAVEWPLGAWASGFGGSMSWKFGLVD